MKILLPLGLSFIFLFLIFAYFSQNKSDKKPIYGANFSPKYARYLGIEPNILLDAILNDLNLKNIRLSAAWDIIEIKQGEYDFTELDPYIEKISRKDGKIILAVGRKLPRWPECHIPSWAKDLSESEQQELVLKLVEQTVNKYKDNPSIYAIQVENEPFMSFGFCPPLDREFLKKEVVLVRSLTQKPIVMTDSGEVRPWISPAKLSDILGISLYRSVYHERFGNIHYPLTPGIYKLKSEIIRNLFAPNNQKTIITELQAEAWVQNGIRETPLDTQINNFSVTKLEENIEFAQKTQFSEVYFWGVEWWYYLKINGHPEYWDYIMSILK